MTTDNEIINEFIELLKDTIKSLEKRKSIPFEEYKKERDIQSIVEREFERAIHCCIDIGARIISIKEFTPVSTYVGIFDRLYEEKVISYNLSEKLKELVRFRNLLIHEYFRISPEKVYQNLQENLYAFSEFIKSVEQFL